MKRTLLLSLGCLLLFTATQAQTQTVKDNPASDSLRQVNQPVPDTQPAFPGGEKEMMLFMGRNLRYPATAQRAGIQGTVLLSFTVMADGSIEAIKVLKALGGGLDEEAIRMVKKMPAWKPALANNVPVAASYLFPVNFKIVNSSQ